MYAIKVVHSSGCGSRFLATNRHNRTFARTSLRRSSSSAGNQFEDRSLNAPPIPTEAQATLQERSDKGILSRMLEKYSLSQQTRRILVAESLLQAATHQASDARWFGPGRIRGDFRSYQALLTMHIWFLHKRLISSSSSSPSDSQDPNTSALIQEELFDIFWTDSTNRMREHGVSEMLMAKNLKTVQQYSFMHCFHYDHCYTGELLESPKERFEELKNLVQTHILLLNPDDEKSIATYDDLSERYAWYIETQYQNIVHDMPEDFFRKARIAWVDLPDFEGLKDANGNELEPQEIDPDDVLPANWARNIANDGTYYYWNTVNRKSQWERPK